MRGVTTRRNGRPEGYAKIAEEGSAIFLCLPEEKVTKYKERKACERVSFLYNWQKKCIGVKFPAGFHLLLRERDVLTIIDLEKKIIDAELNRLQQNGANCRKSQRTLACLTRAGKMLGRYYFDLGSKSAVRFGDLMREPAPPDNSQAPR